MGFSSYLDDVLFVYSKEKISIIKIGDDNYLSLHSSIANQLGVVGFKHSKRSEFSLYKYGEMRTDSGEISCIIYEGPEDKFIISPKTHTFFLTFLDVLGRYVGNGCWYTKIGSIAFKLFHRGEDRTLRSYRATHSLTALVYNNFRDVTAKMFEGLQPNFIYTTALLTDKINDVTILAHIGIGDYTVSINVLRPNAVSVIDTKSKAHTLVDDLEEGINLVKSLYIGQKTTLA